MKLCLALALSFATTTSLAQPSDADLTLGERFAECASLFRVQLTLAREVGAQVNLENLNKMSRVSELAAATLIGDEAFRTGAKARVERATALLRGNDATRLKQRNEECDTLMTDNVERLAPRIKAYVEQKAAAGRAARAASSQQ